MGSRTRVVKVRQNVWQLAQCFHTPVCKTCEQLKISTSPLYAGDTCTRPLVCMQSGCSIKLAVYN